MISALTCTSVNGTRSAAVHAATLWSNKVGHLLTVCCTAIIDLRVQPLTCASHTSMIVLSNNNHRLPATYHTSARLPPVISYTADQNKHIKLTRCDARTIRASQGSLSGRPSIGGHVSTGSSNNPKAFNGSMRRPSMRFGRAGTAAILESAQSFISGGGVAEGDEEGGEGGDAQAAAKGRQSVSQDRRGSGSGKHRARAHRVLGT